MGYYIPGPNLGKAEFLMEKHDAILLTSVEQAREAFLEGLGVICVVNNGPFEAAGYTFSMDELEVFAHLDGRPRRWLAMDKKLAEELSGYDKVKR